MNKEYITCYEWYIRRSYLPCLTDAPHISKIIWSSKDWLVTLISQHDKDYKNTYKVWNSFIKEVVNVDAQRDKLD